MNPIAKEIASYLGSASMSDEEFIEHYGIGHDKGGHSGRYPWGSGDDPYQHATDFLGRIDRLKKEGWKETPENIQKEFGLTVKQYRMEKSICNDERRSYNVAKAKKLRDEGMSTSAIGREMGVNESTVRGWFNAEAESRMLQARKTADFLKEQVDKKRMIDVGKDAELEVNDVAKDLNISREKLDTALYMLEREGYHIYGGRVPQPTNKNQMTTLKVLCAPDVKNSEIFDYDKVQSIKEYISRDGEKTFEKKFHYPESLDSKRLMIRYADDVGPDGARGIDKDGVIELRRGVKDLDLKGSLYSQVRILVDGTHYLKGMAIYSDDMPDGVDVVFNTNKSKDKPMKEVLKKIKDDPDNPFGSAIKDADKGGQYWYDDPKTGKKKLGLINKRADEGDWTEWTNALPSQFLSKQALPMVKKQLSLAKADKLAEFDEIMSLNNPTIKKYYLEKFASSCDSAAVDLKAAALPGQKYHVIIPNNTLSDKEVYAPGYENGTKLALVRYPHGGIFEIPICTVNNKNALGKKLIGTTPIDAICINAKVASQLSGADFDGDTVMCIPTHDRKNKVKISSKDPLDGLKNFSPDQYSYDKHVPADKSADGLEHYYRQGKEFKSMNNQLKQKEMGVVSNLITDMTLLGANDNEIARAVRHSMVVIDAEKHKYDYKQSEIDNDIASLKKEWQIKVDKDGNVKTGGASTIVSRAKGQYSVDKRKGEARINVKGKEWYDPKKPEGSLIYLTADNKELLYVKSTYDKKTHIKTIVTSDGKKISYDMNDKTAREKYEPVLKEDKNSGKGYYTSADGKIKYRTEKRTTTSTNMAETDNAEDLVSKARNPKEMAYADYANYMKALANRARIEMINTGNLVSNPSAKKIYAKEVSSLEVKLNNARKNAPKERAAIRLATAEIKAKQSENPDMSSGDLKKLSQRTLSKYREEVGSVSRRDRSIVITDKEWEAIQAGAISENKLKQILNNSDPDSLRERAMPKDRKSLSQAQINRIKALNNSNFTLDEIAKKMGVSVATVSKHLKGVE